MVKNLLSLLYSRQTSILSGAVIIMATVILSKILGLVRDRLLTHIFPPDTISIFFAAFGLPDIIFQLLIFGALSVAFIPVFTEYAQVKGRDEAFKLAGSIMNLALLILSLAIVVILIFIDPLTNLIAPGFTPEQRLQTISLTRVILLGQLFLVIGSLFSGVLQSFQRFIFPALAGVFYNIGIILGIIFLSNSMGIMGAAVGVVIGAVLHLLIQLPIVLSIGFKPKFLFTLFHPGVKEITGLMSIRSIGLAAELINERVAIALASLISIQSVTFLTLSQHLQLVPISLFGATIAQAALPVLSAEKARGKMEEFKATLLTTLHQILFLALPAAAVLIVLRIPSVRLVFGASQFDWEATVLTGSTLAYLAIGLSAQAISLLFVRGFYALKDTKTPVIVSLIVVAANIALSFYFVRVLFLDVWSLGLAFSLSNILSAILLFGTLHFKVEKFNLRQVLTPLAKMLMAAIIMGVALYIPIKLLDQVIFDTTRTINLLVLTGISSFFALSVYIVLVWFLKVRELKTFIDLIKKAAQFQTKFKSKEMLPESTP
ncbi:murein biosynthesis integral membrane protein MurJ [Candidatus Daviesbacteria bacterium RIFCSPHIGHO2_02_FULL_36_13]|uniref:Probable lipid II flippase MurJ n=1 Tax=Candidatus Daviesbacteria bacterium RIFCSPHIGHO2_02_FULL_36_13 TaxID=1797768 RepID=A0A1F5JWL8_9BACT|nr:MAG: murein biosynthesis integral membrane protein MurJ [Candidatus Daviesbacteria bacterium RIFCSPHIGHO2_02_FULL_36_13]